MYQDPRLHCRWLLLLAPCREHGPWSCMGASHSFHASKIPRTEYTQACCLLQTTILHHLVRIVGSLSSCTVASTLVSSDASTGLTHFLTHASSPVLSSTSRPGVLLLVSRLSSCNGTVDCVVYTNFSRSAPHHS